jgi:hypothetical protein
MRACIILAVAIVSLVFLSGCASEWLVAISTDRIEVEAPSSNTLTEAEALSIFSDISGQLGLSVRGPVSQQNNNGPVIVYDAIAHNHLSLDLHVTKRSTIVYCRSDKSAAEAQRAASLFERALDEHGVKYSVSTQTGSIFNN